LTLPLDTRLIGFDRERRERACAIALLRFRVDVHHRRTIRRARRLPLPQPARSQQPLTMSTSVPIARSHFHCPPTQPSTPAATARRRTPAPAVLNNPTHHTPLARRQIAEESAHRSWRDPKSWITADIHALWNVRNLRRPNVTRTRLPRGHVRFYSHGPPMSLCKTHFASLIASDRERPVAVNMTLNT
jgi:hypothetical protein